MHSQAASLPVLGSDADCEGTDPCRAGRCDASAGACSFDAVPECCRGDADCDDADVCTTDRCDPASNRCEGAAIDACCRADDECPPIACSAAMCDPVTNECVYEPVAGCCASEAECDDGDECTLDRCTGSACVHEPDPACAPAGCGCRAPGSRRATPAVAAFLMLLVAAALGRRR